MRRTKIVCTIGPATESEAQLEKLVLAGMNVARLNFSHGAHEAHAAVIERVRRISERLSIPVAILLDLQGPKIRVGSLQDGQPIKLIDGATVTITTRKVPGTGSEIPTTYQSLARDVKEGDRILLDDGLLELRVLAFNATDVSCLVIHGGLLKEHKGINLPGVDVSAPSLTEKDLEDLRFGVSLDVDYVALSFVRKAQDVLDAKEHIRIFQDEYQHGQDYKLIPLIAKLEKPEAVANLEEILKVVDGAMVARGDLGVEMPPEQVPLIQKHIIARCNDLGLPVITATQMLESMITNPSPTRAEVSDVANSIVDGTDAIMLSAETSVGAFPIEAVQMMVRIAHEIETNGVITRQPHCQKLSQEHAVSHAARALSEEASVKAIVVFTRTGATAKLISTDRPSRPIFAYTPSQQVYRRLALWWGTWSYMIPLSGTTDELIYLVERRLIDDHLMQKGDNVVIMGGLPVASEARTNFVKLHCVDNGK
jgi:pyruvate kinase